MSEKLPRRGFLTRLSVGLSSLAAMPLAGMAKSSNDENMEAEPQVDTPIIKIKPLGFQWETQDPFLFCVHHEDKYPKGNPNLGPDPSSLSGRNIGQDFLLKDGWRMYHGRTVPGFPAHPHRGFETVTVVREGMVDHADSMGASGRYGDGDVQWMTAGGGVQHAEMFPLVSQEDENPMELFQIWLNLPRKDKMVKPHFKMLWGDTIPKYEHKDDSGRKSLIEVMAGTLNGNMAPSPPPNSWANDPANEVAIWNIKMEPNAIWVVPKASPGTNRTIYFYQGDKLQIAGTDIPKYHAVEVRANMDAQIKNGDNASGLLILQGRPIGEPVVQHGPFVMNTREEIAQTFEDYQKTRFGGWPWPTSDPTHGSERKRFAKHADGKEEKRG